MVFNSVITLMFKTLQQKYFFAFLKIRITVTGTHLPTAKNAYLRFPKITTEGFQQAQSQNQKLSCGLLPFSIHKGN